MKGSETDPSWELVQLSLGFPKAFIKLRVATEDQNSDLGLGPWELAQVSKREWVAAGIRNPHGDVSYVRKSPLEWLSYLRPFSLTGAEGVGT